jgi:hypothetical protein
MSENPQARTTLRLVPPLPITDNQDVAVVEVKGEALVMAAKIDDYVVVYMGAAPDVWHLDGERVTAKHDLLAHRKHDGAWRVIDPRMSSLCPKIDNHLEA